MSETIFKEVRYDLGSLVNFIELGEIGLPDIQRPFVWKNSKIRNLFDSMYRGFPIGYLLLWHNSPDEDGRTVGIDIKQKVARLLIVDGQQRLTSLYAVLKGIPVLRDNYQSETIEIAFNPLQEKFEVADAAIRKDRAFLPNISVLWSKNTDIFEIVDDYIENLSIARQLSKDEEKKIKKSITKLHSLLSYPITSLELSAEVDEEQVSEVFVRINSEGKKLNQADFILTLMSVFWDEGRKDLENFCRKSRTPQVEHASPFNHFIEPDPDQLLRVSIGLAFKRGRIQSVYSVLRGKDLSTNEFNPDLRVKQFSLLKEAQAKVLNIQYWHDFFKCLRQAGFQSAAMISSSINIIFCYTLYLIGRTEYKVDEFQLQHAMSKWFFMSNITGRFTSSPESKFEFDLARFRDVKDGATFLKILHKITDETMSEDFWSITLPNQLATSAARSPSLFAYYAALNLLGAKALFSKHKISEINGPIIKAQRNNLEKHHLFPKEYLKSIGVLEQRERNQIANYALVEWGDNNNISKQSPKEYLPKYSQRFSGKELQEMYYWHALPDNWEALDYQEFLMQRRELMAAVIKRAYESFAGNTKESVANDISIQTVILSGESNNVEFKSSLRMNLHTNQKDPRMETSCLKTIAGFLNSKGGTLFVGINDDGEAIGIDVDQFESEDKMNLHLVNLIKDKISPQHMMYIHVHFKDHDDKRVLVIDCDPSKSPAYLKENGIEKLYIRTGASTSELSVSQAQDYIKQKFAA